MNAVNTNDKNRDYLFDNLKAILIILVVWGHLLASMRAENDVIKSIYFFIFFFHMPAMVFISGYFSKKLDKIRNNAVVTLLIPYLMLNSIDYFYKILILGEEYFGFRFFNPNWGLWYLLTLFLWKFLLKDLIKLKFILPFSFVFALLSGFSKEFSEYMALGRMVCFLPFFLLGYYAAPEHIARLRKVPKGLFLLIPVTTGLLSVFVVYKDIFDTELLFLRSYYPEGEEIQTMLFRLLIYIVALAMLGAMINLTSERKSFLTYLGTSTMTVYVLHIFTIPALEKLELFKNQPYLYLAYSVLMTVLIAFIYSRNSVKNAYDFIMSKLTQIVLIKEK